LFYLSLSHNQLTLETMSKITYPLISAVIVEWPNTVIDETYEEILNEKPEQLAELLTLTKKETYEQVLVEYEGYTLEELIEVLA
jgi:hypothetical protein